MTKSLMSILTLKYTFGSMYHCANAAIDSHRQKPYDVTLHIVLKRRHCRGYFKMHHEKHVFRHTCLHRGTINITNTDCTLFLQLTLTFPNKHAPLFVVNVTGDRIFWNILPLPPIHYSFPCHEPLGTSYLKIRQMPKAVTHLVSQGMLALA